MELALAYTAGLVATLNPCGFAMLPAYLSLFLGLEDGAERRPAARAAAALQVGAVVSAGFLVVFGLAGVLLTLGVQAVVTALPWLAMAVGAGLLVLGVSLLAGHGWTVRLPGTGHAPTTASRSGMFWFGVSYAIASLSCTLPVFLVVVAGTIPRLGLLAGAVTFLVYGVGMASVLLLVTVAVASGKHALVGRLRRASQHVSRITGAILVLAGAYLVFFWATTLTGDTTTTPTLVRWLEQLSSRATNLVAGAPGRVAGATIGLLAALALRAAMTHPPDRT